ncbi:MAG: hypothetical protein HY735_29540 [Verrucomicrobia bacterium]|nr:hypothetical protein [Verrucomicrobiota bacterium]
MQARLRLDKHIAQHAARHRNDFGSEAGFGIEEAEFPTVFVNDIEDGFGLQLVIPALGKIAADEPMHFPLRFLRERVGTNDTGDEFEAMEFVFANHVSGRRNVKEASVGPVAGIRNGSVRVRRRHHKLANFVTVKIVVGFRAEPIPKAAHPALAFPSVSERNPVGVILVTPGQRIVFPSE